MSSIWPPRRIQGLLGASALVHPTYPLAVFCPMVEKRDKFEPVDKEKTFEQTIAAVTKRASEVAKAWRDRRATWLGPLQQQGLARVVTVEAKTRAVLWLGSPSATELGFCLHHVYGIPYLPPTALKGVTSSAAWRSEDPGASPAPPLVLELFGEGGDQGHEGRVAFLDGIPVGDRNGRVSLDLDVMTPHHKDYYAGHASMRHDCEGPNPLLFLCIPPGQRFEIGLVYTREPDRGRRGPQHWLNEAEQHLLQGLQSLGLGAKTTSGYGVFERVGSAGASPAQTTGGPAPADPGAPRDVVATILTIDKNRAIGRAKDEQGQEFEFPAALLASKLAIYRQNWSQTQGQSFVFEFRGDKVVNIRKREGSS